MPPSPARVENDDESETVAKEEGKHKQSKQLVTTSSKPTTTLPSTPPPQETTTTTATAQQHPKPTTTTTPLWQRHRCRADSLRIGASNIAALAGYHPFKILPELVLNLVYQGPAGRTLLQHDAELLGLEFVASPVEMLEELAHTAGPATLQALQQALQTTPQHVPQATALKQAVTDAAQASGQLSDLQLAMLQNGVRSLVDTSFGTHHEDAALDWLQQATNCEIRMRNAELLQWPFQIDCNNSTVVPLGPPRPSHKKRPPPSDPPESSGAHKTAKLDKAADSQGESEPRQVVDLTKDDTVGAPTVQEGVSATTRRSGADQQPNQEEQPRPFFYIVGTVDGIRDELKCRDDGDEDDWYVQSSIVEVKHRMRRVHAQIPLYEQIQATAYCLMYNVPSADLVQAMRTPKTPDDEQPPQPQQQPRAPLAPVPPSRHQSNGKIEKQGQPNLNKPEGATKKDHNTDKEEDEGTIHCTMHRIALDDPVLQHRQQWTLRVLPRLRSMVQAVYDIRRDDGRRFQLLLSVAEGTTVSGTFDEGWKLLHEACPWLLECDTAAGRSSGGGGNGAFFVPSDTAKAVFEVGG